MAKVTIYVPDELLSVVRETEVSMSPVCQRALQQEVDRVQALTTATSDIQRVAERLRATIAEEAVNDYRRAFDLGAEWARSTATYSELRLVVEEAFRQPGLGGPGRFLTGIEGVRTYVDRDDSGRLASEEFTRGFVDGAKAVYREVQPLL